MSIDSFARALEAAVTPATLACSMLCLEAWPTVTSWIQSRGRHTVNPSTPSLVWASASVGGSRAWIGLGWARPRPLKAER